MERKALHLVLLAILALSSCIPKGIIPPPEELGNTPVPTPASFDEVLRYMGSYAVEERIVGMWAALSYPDKVSEVLPFVIGSLYYEGVYDVREAAAKVLGEFGPAAASAVPDLVAVMQNDRSIRVRVAAAIALGNIGDKAAVPFLAKNLYEENESLAAFSAKSISKIVGEGFPDSQGGGYSVTKQGVPLIMAAREWWESEGKYQEWPAIDSDRR